MTVKHKNSISFPEAQKIAEGYRRGKSYFQIVKERLNEKLLLLEPNDWPKFINEIKPTMKTDNISNTNTYPKINQNKE